MNRLTTRELNLLIFGGFIAVAIMIWVYLLQPTWLKYDEELNKLSELNKSLSELKQMEKDLQEGTVNQDLNKISGLDKKLPNTPETAEILYYLQTAAKSQGAVLAEFSGEQQADKKSDKKESTKPEDLSKVVSYKVLVGGQFQSIAGFLQQLEQFPRVIWVKKGKIEVPQTAFNGINVGPIIAEFQIDTFYLPQNRPYQDNVVPKPPARGKANPF